VADYWQSHWPAWLLKNRRWLVFLTIFMIGGGIWQLAPHDDVRLLQSPSADLMEAANKISQLLPYSRENQFFLVSGADMHEWRRNEQNLLGRLDLAVQRRQLKSYQGLSSFWPDEDLQKQNYRLLADGLYHSGKIPAYMNKLGFSADAIAAEAKQFDIARNRLISLPDWLADADESQQSLWLGCEHNQCASIVAISGLKSAAAISGWLNLPGVAWVDPVEDLNSLFARYRIRASLLLLSAFCIVFTGLGFRFGWRNALAITSIPVFAALASLAVSGWFHQMFGLFNLFALLLVLGIGTDDAVFFFMAKRTDSTSISPENNFHDKRATTSLAVTLSALTTLLAFGLLAASSTEVVHAFGCTVASGITAALLCSPLVGYKKA
jgi:predicted exporter